MGAATISSRRQGSTASERCTHRLNAPSVSEPERLTGLFVVAGLHLRWGKAFWVGPCARFPEPHPVAVRVPESFRGGCSFGAGRALENRGALAGLSHNDRLRMSHGHCIDGTPEVNRRRAEWRKVPENRGKRRAKAAACGPCGSFPAVRGSARVRPGCGSSSPSDPPGSGSPEARRGLKPRAGFRSRRRPF